MKAVLEAPRKYDSIIIDGMNLAIASYHAGSSFSYNGHPTGCLFLGLKKVLSLMKDYPEAEIVAVWEGGSPRTTLMPDYKAQRRRQADDFFDSYHDLSRALSLLGVKQLAHSGAEADDLAHWYVRRHPKRTILLLSTDHDWYQFLGPNVDIMMKSVVYTEQVLNESLGFPANRILIIKVLTGDMSDNVKGLYRFPMALARKIAGHCSDYKEMRSYPFEEKEGKWHQLILDQWEQIELNAKVLMAHAEWIRDEAVAVGQRGLTPEDREKARAELQQMLEANGIRSLRF